jgi:PAP2 superfamily
MNSTSHRLRRAVSRSVGRVPVILVVVSLICGSAAAAADDIVLRWNEISARTATATSPFDQARVTAIVQLAVFEAVNAITGQYEPYLNPATTPAPGASVKAAVATAASIVMTTYFPAATAALNTARDNDLGTIPNGAAKDAGIAVGTAAANAMIALRAADGSSPLLAIIPSSTAPGDYQLTTGCPAAMFYNWQNVTPFGIPNASAFLVDPPPALAKHEYTRDYAEVATVGASTSADRPQDRADVVRLYAGSSPSFVVNMATRQIAAAKRTSVSENARALALINMAISDSLVASFFNKYHYNRWRPETAIRNGAADGNRKTEGDLSFASFIPAPCFPSYPSNHASGTDGGLEALRRLFGAAGHDITITNAVPALGSLPATVITESYTQLKQIANDVDDARVYGGIHFRYDQDAGGVLGRAIATEVVKNHLRPLHP